MWKVRVGFMCVVNSPIFGSSFFTDFGLSLLPCFLSCKARTSNDISTATRDVAREAAERIMVNLDSLFMTITTTFPSVVVSHSSGLISGSKLVHIFIQRFSGACLFLCHCSRICENRVLWCGRHGCSSSRKCICIT